jgi:hypothetical protein
MIIRSNKLKSYLTFGDRSVRLKTFNYNSKKG